jgi:hypothetical protein
LRRTCGLDGWAGSSVAGAVSCKDGVPVNELSTALDALEQQLERTQSQLPTQSQSALPQSQALAASAELRAIAASLPRNETAAASSSPSSASAMEKRRNTRPV